MGGWMGVWRAKVGGLEEILLPFRQRGGLGLVNEVLHASNAAVHWGVSVPPF